MSVPITRDQRHTRRHRCPICGGADEDLRGRGKRCNGFTVNGWTHCSREEHAGSLTPDNGALYAHRLGGPCKCGATHGGAAPNDHADGAIEAVYDYHDEHGALLFQVVRKRPQGNRKRFLQRRPDGDGWKWSIEGVQRVLYRLPELLRADAARTVFIVEGEKDVESLMQRGQVATCNPGGAGKWHVVATMAASALSGRDVLVIADADDAGRPHAQQVASAVAVVARRVRVVELPGAKDAAEFFEKGATVADLEAFVATAPTWRPAAHDDDDVAERAAIDNEHELIDTHPSAPPSRWPAPLEAPAFHSLLGQFVLAVQEHTEADPAAILVQLLAAVGCMLGPPPPAPPVGDDEPVYSYPPCVQVGAERHPPHLHAVVVGGTKTGRKGTALAIVRALCRAVDESWWRRCAQPGVSTGEGIIAAVRDWEQPARAKDAPTVPAPPPRDKRLLLIEEEFGRPLAAMNVFVHELLKAGVGIRVLPNNTLVGAVLVLVDVEPEERALLLVVVSRVCAGDA